MNQQEMMMETKPEVEMSDVSNETQEPVTVTVADLVNSIEKGDAFTSSKMFQDLIQDRINDAMDQEKIRIANQVYNGAEEELSDEEVEAAIDEVDAEIEAEAEAETEVEVEAEAEAEPEVAEVEEPEVEEEPTPEEPVAELPDEEEHEEPEDTLGLYADEVEEILNSEESEDESEEENV
jgi:hypothetical protein